MLCAKTYESKVHNILHITTTWLYSIEIPTQNVIHLQQFYTYAIRYIFNIISP